jgi:hypothetical protein
MSRTPFVWEVRVRREVLEEELAGLRELPYSLWHDVMPREMCKTTRARDNKPYRVRISAAWASAGSRDIRVTAALETLPLGRRLLHESFVITAENRITDDLSTEERS